MAGLHPPSTPARAETPPPLDTTLAALGIPLATLLDSIDAGMVLTDTAGRVLHWNGAASRMYGETMRQDALPLPALAAGCELSTPQGLPLADDQRPLARTLRGEPVRDLELRLSRPDRSGWSRLLSYSGTLLADAAGAPCLALLTIRDVTECSELQEQLRQRVEELETLMDVAPVALFVADDPQCEHMVGNCTANAFYDEPCGANLSAACDVGREVPERRFLRDGRELALEELPMQQAAAEDREVANCAIDVQRRDGSRFTMLGSARPLHDREGRVRGCVGAFLDITERRQMEAQLERALAESARQRAELEEMVAELEGFSYSVSHDLRAPARHIIGMAGILREEAWERLEPDNRRHLETILASARGLADALEALLAYTRIGRSAPSIQPVDLEALVHELIATISGAEAEREVQWAVESLPLLEADPAMLRLVFTNLLENALKFTRERRPARITVGSSELPGARTLFVQDNGVGFDMRFRDQLFGAFNRLHSRHEYAGTGLGLANVRRIAERHGWRVDAHGQEGVGATFSITVPHAPAAATPAHAASAIAGSG